MRRSSESQSYPRDRDIIPDKRRSVRDGGATPLLRSMLGRFRGAGQVRVLVRSFLNDGSGDVKIENVLAGLDASKEMLVARVDESDAALNVGRGLHFIS